MARAVAGAARDEDDGGRGGGRGEVKAAPVLVRRIAQELGHHHVHVPRPVRIKRPRVGKPGEIERFVLFAARDAGEGDRS